MCTPIPGPRRFIMTWVERALLPITNGRHPSCTNAGPGKVLFRSIGTTLTESQIILVRATLVTVPFDLGPYRGILIQKTRFPIKDRPGISAQVILIKVEINILVLERLKLLLANGRSSGWRGVEAGVEASEQPAAALAQPWVEGALPWHSQQRET